MPAHATADTKMPSISKEIPSISKVLSKRWRDTRNELDMHKQISSVFRGSKTCLGAAGVA